MPGEKPPTERYILHRGSRHLLAPFKKIWFLLSAIIFITWILLFHGANHLEDDHHGASLLHCAAGTGNLRAVQALLKVRQEDGTPVHDIIASDQVAKDGATVLHWAACGVTLQGVFGIGGHVTLRFAVWC
jgi:Ankyrin repeats (3 copies)